jgi:hypothetical protein
MAYPSVTYTFSNSTTADASQVNQNFTDLISGLSDGTKDLSVSAITAAGNVTLNGNTTIGNASSDTLTLTASLASNLVVSAHNTYDIGTVTTLGLRSIYFSSSSATKTARLIGPATSSDLTVTLPDRTGTLQLVNSISSTKTTTYAITNADDVILYSLASGSYTTTLPTAVGIAGRRFTLVLVTAGTGNLLTIATTSSQTMGPYASGGLKMASAGDSVTLISDGTNWQVESLKIDVSARYTTNAGNNVTNATVTYVDYEDKDFDALSMCSGTGSGNVTTTNTGFKCTIPVSGKYRVTVSTLSASGGGWAAGEQWVVGIYVNNTSKAFQGSYSQATHTAPMTAQVSATLSLVAGDIVEPACYQASGGTLAIDTSATYNCFHIERL